jgi:hypothetical protein
MSMRAPILLPLQLVANGDGKAGKAGKGKACKVKARPAAASGLELEDGWYSDEEGNMNVHVNGNVYRMTNSNGHGNNGNVNGNGNNGNVNGNGNNGNVNGNSNNGNNVCGASSSGDGIAGDPVDSIWRVVGGIWAEATPTAAAATAATPTAAESQRSRSRSA